MEPKNTGKSWRTLVSSISNDYPAWFYVQLQDVMKYVYFELEGIDLEHQEERRVNSLDSTIASTGSPIVHN